MKWRVCVLHPAFEKRFKRGDPCPPKAWEEREHVVTRSYVTADAKAKRNHPNRIVHTYIDDK